MTPVQLVYDHFFNYITDDMYYEISEEQTQKDCHSLLLSSLPMFEFPTKPFSFVYQMEFGEKIMYFEQDLTLEEINILATGMVQIWAQRQVTSIEAMRQRFSGTDFKLSSQASHLQRLMKVLEDIKIEHRRLQMLHSRRRVNSENGNYESNFDKFVLPMNSKVAKPRKTFSLIN